MSLYIGVQDPATGRKYAQLIATTVSEAFIQELVDDYFSPAIGDVKYLAIPIQLTIDVNSESFDGWVYADGSSYTVPSGKFTIAKQMFGGNPSDTTITTPNLCYFACPYPDKFSSTWPSGSDKAAVQLQQGNCGCTYHKHHINTAINYAHGSSFVIKNAFKMRLTGTTGHTVAPESGKTKSVNSTTWYNLLDSSKAEYSYYPAGHGTGKDFSSKDQKIEVDLNFNANLDFSTFPTGESGSASPAPYPANVPIYVMVYIGRK